MGRVPFSRSFAGFAKRKRKTFPRGKLFALDRPGLIDGSASEAIVYAGKHYGRKHRILFDTGNLVTLIHEPSGDTLTVHGCDVETETPNYTCRWKVFHDIGY